MDQDDPADWSIDRVITEVCNTSSPVWAVGADLKPIIDPQAIATALRKNDIDGEDLLTLDDNHIKADLHIDSYGRRQRLNNIIAHLRSLSPKYQARLARRSGTALATSYWSPNAIQSQIQSPSLYGVGIYPSIETIKGDQQNSVMDHNHSPRLIQSTLQHKRARDDGGSGGPAPAGISIAGLNQPHSFLNTLDTAVDEELSTNKDLQTNLDSVVRHLDDVSSHSQGTRQKPPKRATLQPASDPRIDGNGTHWISETINNKGLYNLPHDQDNNSMVEPPSKRPRITDDVRGPLPSRNSDRSISHSRLRRNIQRADMFSPQCESTSTNLPSNELNDDSREFDIYGRQPASGRLKRAARHISSSQVRQRKRKHKLLPNTLVAQPEQPIKDNTLGAHLLPNLPNFEFSVQDLELLRRYPVEEDGAELPCYGDSDEEDRWTTSSESTPPPVTSTHVLLSKDEVDNVIDQSLDQFVADWRSRNLVKVQARAYKKWIFAAKNRFLHDGMLNEVRMWREKASSRIRTLRNGIHVTQWQKSDDIKQQCLAIETSVHQLEEYSTYVNVLECDQEPYMPPRAELKRTRLNRLHTTMENGDEELDSDSAASFIVEDEDDDVTDHGKVAVQVEAPTWNPKFAETSLAASRGDKLQVSAVDAAREMSRDNIEASRNDQPLRQGHLGEAMRTGNDDKVVLIDVSDEDISRHPLRSSGSATKKAAVESARRNPITIPYLTDSEDDDSDLDRSPRYPMTKYRKIGKSQDKAIDLTGTSPQPQPNSPMSVSSATSIRTPKLHPIDAFASNMKSGSQTNGQKPSGDTSSNTLRQGQSLIFDVKRVLSMDWDEITPLEEIDPIDHRLGLAKAVYELSTRYARSALDYLTSFRDDEDLREILINGLRAEQDAEGEIADVEKKNQNNAKRLTNLLISYSTGCSVTDDFELSDKQADDAFDLLSSSMREFCELLEALLRKYIRYTALPSEPATMSRHQLSDDTDTEPDEQPFQPTHNSPFKARKRQVVQSKTVLDQQRQDQYRVAELEKKRAFLLQQQSDRGANSNQLAIPINVEEPIVYLDPKLAARAKPHQVEGIRFMWRELIENERHEGCLLAHTMGLGKTMQVIALLATIAQCNTSDDPAMRAHIPSHLQRFRIMILCPLAIVENWYEELLQWLPDHLMLGVIFKLDIPPRLVNSTIRRWFEDGGVLILNYEKYRSLVRAPHCDPSGVEFEDLKQRYEHLTEGPDLIVADEAHRMKNAKSRLNDTTNRISTKSRIALTGSPLNNHLEEYHTMISWISAGYLGTIVQFRARYAEPINQGLYSTSTSWEKKNSMKRLHMLKKTIAPKINRADITAISNDLPPKTEFFLTLAMTKEQMQAYQVYVTSLRDEAVGGFDKQSNTHVWSWLSVLSLLLSHPSCFIDKLQQREASRIESVPQPQRAGSNDDGDDGIRPVISVEDVDVTQQSELARAMEKVLEIFEEARVILRMDDPSLSSKSLLIQKILQEAVQLGEKTLIFSKSIPTLNYYENMVRDMKLAYKRIDGQRASAPGVRQREIAEFNGSDKYQVFLISTRAGGLGLNIQSASRVIISDFDFNPTWEEQAIGRAYRIGQTKPVFVYRLLMGGTFEEKIHNKAVFKTQLFHRVVDEKNVVSQAEKKPSDFLFDPKEVPKKDFGECLGKDPGVLDRVLQKVDCVRDIFLTETFFQDVDEELNEQELKEANDLLEMERLERDNPEEYARKVNEKKRAQARDAQHAMKKHSEPMPPNMVSMGIYNHFVNMSVPSVPDARYKVTTGTSNSPVSGSLPHPPRPGGSYGDEFVMATQHSRPSIGSLFQSKDDQTPLTLQQATRVNTLAQIIAQSQRASSPYFMSFKNGTPVTRPNSGTASTASVAADSNILSNNRLGSNDPPASNHNTEGANHNGVLEDDANANASKSAQGCRPQ